jgi:hypothetical protein
MDDRLGHLREQREARFDRIDAAVRRVDDLLSRPGPTWPILRPRPALSRIMHSKKRKGRCTSSRDASRS